MTTQDERQGRAQAEAQRRRRRGSEDFQPARKLEIPPEIAARLEAEGLEPRWVNDDGNRIYHLTKRDDYDVVEGVEPVPAGTGKDGRPIKAHLLAKRKDFIAEDRAAQEERRKQTEAGLLQGNIPGAAANPNPASATTYVAKGSRIGRENQILE